MPVMATLTQTATADGMLLYIGQPVKCSVAQRLDKKHVGWKKQSSPLAS